MLRTWRGRCQVTAEPRYNEISRDWEKRYNEIVRKRPQYSLHQSLDDNYFALKLNAVVLQHPVFGWVAELLHRFEQLNEIRDLGSACISVDLLRIQLQLRDDVYSLLRGNSWVWASVLCSLYRGLRYTGARCISGFCPIHFTVTLAGLKNIVRYSVNIVIPWLVTSWFHWALLHKET